MADQNSFLIYQDDFSSFMPMRNYGRYAIFMSLQ